MKINANKQPKYQTLQKIYILKTKNNKTNKETNKKSISHIGHRLCAWETYMEVVEPTSFKMSIYLLPVVRISKKYSKILPNIVPKSK